jgi:uncharacterized protein (DUF58 family)
MRSRTKRYRIDPPLVLYTGMTIVVGLGALLSQNNLLYFVFGIALSVLLISGVVTGRSFNRVQVRRLSLPTATVGEPIMLRYRLVNRGRLIPACALWLTEIQHGRGSRLGEFEGGFIPLVRPGESQVVQIRVTPLSRGVHKLSHIRVTTRFPFGVLLKSLDVRTPAELLVRPSVTTPSQDVLRAIESQRTHHRGAIRTQQAETDIVFSYLREYMPGDSIRQIAWKSSARREGLVIRQSTIEGGSQLLVVLLLHPDEPESQNSVRRTNAQENESVLSLGAGVLRHATALKFRVGLAIPGIEHVRMPMARSIDSNRWESMLLDDLARVRLEDVNQVEQVGWRMPTDLPIIIVRAPGAEGPDGLAGVPSITPTQTTQAQTN